MSVETSIIEWIRSFQSQNAKMCHSRDDLKDGSVLLAIMNEMYVDASLGLYDQM